MTHISTDQRLILVTGGTGKTGRRVVHRLRAAGHPVRVGSRTADVVSLLDYLFGTVLDGRNADPADGVRRALGRNPKDFTDYVMETAVTGIRNVPAA
ncbi:NAD-dependent epimerase/dehydratase family protein [Nocardia asiatica]|uniref:NAD-dependent epimerase/dehydratase family protein n=1 Tax=Nocardia asiatica TaxID=209252 RepID=UPI002457BDEC|nr:NAD-dependent epimerase/dehydratase family protein [Nocardia asiatica]